MNGNAGSRPASSTGTADLQPARADLHGAAGPDDLIRSILIDPPPREWRSWVSPRQLPPRARRFREQLGLPDEAPLIMTGHQAAFWHAGILAKYLAADAAARAFGARTAWIVVDQDANDFASVRYPVRTSEGRLAARTWLLTHQKVMDPEGQPLPTGSIPPFAPEPLPVLSRGDRFASDSVEPGLRAIRESLLRHAAAARSAADQIRGALDDLLLPFVARAPSVFATDFARTDLFREVVGRMRDDPGACIRAYNAAVLAHPHARMTTLAINETQYIYELPLWRLDPAAAGQRRRVYAEELDDIPIEQLAPRAALMTGLLRLAEAGACELFIAGTGGGGERGYERVAEEWLQAWLGEPLTPEAVVTATVHLDTGDRIVTEDEVARALWRAHHARHDPALLDDDAAARQKMDLVRQIERIRQEGRSSPEAFRLFRAMHDLLEQTRKARAAALQRIETETAAAVAARRDAEIATDRTWPFPLHDPGVLRALHERVADLFA